MASHGEQVKPVLIEATSKKYKAAQVAGGALLLFALIALLLGAGSVIPIVLCLGGLGAYVYGRGGAWWHHR